MELSLQEVQSPKPIIFTINGLTLRKQGGIFNNTHSTLFFRMTSDLNYG